MIKQTREMFKIQPYKVGWKHLGEGRIFKYNKTSTLRIRPGSTLATLHTWATVRVLVTCSPSNSGSHSIQQSWRYLHIKYNHIPKAQMTEGGSLQRKETAARPKWPKICCWPKQSTFIASSCANLCWNSVFNIVLI